MKPQKLLTYCLIFASFVSLIISCKKNDVNQKKPACKIITINENSGSSSSVYKITYNNDGKISTLNEGTSTSVFTYSGSTIIKNGTNNGSFSERDSITVDNNGRPLNVRQYYDQAGTTWYNNSFEYNGNGELLKSYQTSNASSIPETTLYTITGGNLVGIQTSSDNLTLEYFSDKPSQPGDYLEVISLISYGVSLYPHKNLLKSVNSGGSITNFNYETNADGLVTKFTATSGSSIETLAYQYQCN